MKAMPHAYLFTGKKCFKVDMELIKEGVNLTFEFLKDDLIEPPRFSFEVGMVLVITRHAVEEFSDDFIELFETMKTLATSLPPK